MPNIMNILQRSYAITIKNIRINIPFSNRSRKYRIRQKISVNTSITATTFEIHLECNMRLFIVL